MIFPSAAELAATRAASSFTRVLPKVSIFNSNSAKSIGSTISSIFSNKGVQIGLGLGVAGLGLSGLDNSVKQAVNPLGVPLLSPILLIAIVGVILFLFVMLAMKK